MRHIRLLVAALVTTACSGAGEAPPEAPPTSKIVQWSAVAATPRAAPDGGSVIDVALKANVASGWKLYSLTQKGGGPVPMSVRLDSASGYTIEGEVTGPAATRDVDPNFGIETETYQGTPAFTVLIKVPADVDGSRPIELKVRSQACSDRLCLPARTQTVTVDRVSAGS